MESLASLEKIRSQIHASHLYLIVFEALMCWEWLSLLRVEYVHVIRAKWTLFKVCYLLKYVIPVFSSLDLARPRSDANPGTCSHSRYGVLVLATIDTALILAPISRGKFAAINLVLSTNELIRFMSVELCRKISWIETFSLVYSLVCVQFPSLALRSRDRCEPI